jgi:hypothetical protein
MPLYDSEGLKVFLEIHAAVETGDLVSIAVEHERGLALVEERSADAALGLLAPAWMVDIGVYVGIKTVLGAMSFQAVGGWSAVKCIFTIDLADLKPYFHGTTMRTGAPS